jgi:hypothetical protein
VLRNVKGVLFADYVRMIRGQKNVDWSKRLAPEDMSFLVARVDPAGWYPMATFERMGNAILAEIAGGNVEAARFWGRTSVDRLHLETPSLVAEGDPLETLMRFRVLRRTFFDFEALVVHAATEGDASIEIHYFMGPLAEEAASYQTMGFFERLLIVAGATAVEARFTERSWAGDARTLLRLSW